MECRFHNDLLLARNRCQQNIKEQSSASGESNVNSTNKADNVMAAFLNWRCLILLGKES